MNKYKEPELLVIYLAQTDVLTESDGVVVEPGEDWE